MFYRRAVYPRTRRYIHSTYVFRTNIIYPHTQTHTYIFVCVCVYERRKIIILKQENICTYLYYVCMYV